MNTQPYPQQMFSCATCSRAFSFAAVHLVVQLCCFFAAMQVKSPFSPTKTL